ncbi:TPA: exodeoxyribonuclease V subunit beta [Klebsiella pneumoniae]
MPGRDRLTAGLAAPHRRRSPHLHLAAFMPSGHNKKASIKGLNMELDEYIKSLSPKEITSLQKDFEERCAKDIPDCPPDKDPNGQYISINTQAMWEGYMTAEKWVKYDQHQKITLPVCPEPIDGWCDCYKCKAMRFHKKKEIYVCLVCHKQAEPLKPVSFTTQDSFFEIFEDE